MSLPYLSMRGVDNAEFSGSYEHGLVSVCYHERDPEEMRLPCLR